MIEGASGITQAAISHRLRAGEVVEDEISLHFDEGQRVGEVLEVQAGEAEELPLPDALRAVGAEDEVLDGGGLVARHHEITAGHGGAHGHVHNLLCIALSGDLHHHISMPRIPTNGDGAEDAHDQQAGQRLHDGETGCFEAADGGWGRHEAQNFPHRPAHDNGLF